MPTLVKAESKNISASNFLPRTDLENLELSNANVVYCDENLTAIVEDSYLFTLYYNGEKIVVNDDTTLNEILDVKLFDSSSLYFSANARLYCYNLQTRTYQKVLLNNSIDEPVSYFDFNQDYLVTTYQATCKIFKITNNAFTSVSTNGIKISDGSNVAINEYNELFIVGSTGIYKTLASLPGIQTIENTLINSTPSTLIANNSFLYYIFDGKICRIALTDGSYTELSTLKADSDYQLGNIVAPKKISFMKDNILVLQNDSIQEFEVNGNELIFTGFAIAKGKTAYNRILSNATKIEKVNDTIAVLDNYKLTVFTNNNSRNRYARENYKNYLLSSLILNNNGITPSSFALGNGNALLLYDDNGSEYLSLLDFSKSQNALSKKTTIEVNTNIIDVCYQSGSYYVLCDDGKTPQHVYKSTITDGQLSFTKIDANESTIDFATFTVDVYGNVYLANDTVVAKLEKNDGYTSLQNVGTFNAITRLQTDLLGNLFVLANGKVQRLNNSTEYSIENIKTFALDFVDNDAYFIKNDSELIYSTTEMDNVSIADLNVPNDYTLTNPQGVYRANETLEFYTMEVSANAYVVHTQGDKFIFEELTAYSGEYVKICTVEYMNTPAFYVLANQNDIVLIDVQNVKNVDKQKVTDILETAFVATDVHPYYLPIINANSDFAFNDTHRIRLSKTTKIDVIHKIEFLGCEYYYAKVNLNNKTYYAYIPCTFTVEVLNEDFEWDSYKLENVKKVSVYDDSDMQNKITTLDENTQVRLIEKGKNVSKIAYKLDDGTYQIGYIYTNKIIDNPSIAIRNILIIIAVAACVCGTLTYFLLRKRKSN